jgi:hypothetical protein
MAGEPSARDLQLVCWELVLPEKKSEKGQGGVTESSKAKVEMKAAALGKSERQ